MSLEQVAAVGMRNDAFRATSIAHNIANALTPGFKGARPFATALAVSGGTSVRPGAGETLALSPRIAINTAQGAFRTTSVATDIAIDGDGWFELQGSESSRYARTAQLRIDDHGLLVNTDGLPLLGQAGPIHLDNAPFSVNSAGEVVQGGATLGKLRQVRFERAELLEPQGGALYALGGASVSEARTPDSVRTGVLEASNVDTSKEMVALSETVRHFESLQRIVEGYDTMLESTIRKLGEF